MESEQAHPFRRLASEFAVLDFINSRRIRGSDDMRKISLSAPFDRLGYSAIGGLSCPR